MFFLIQGGKTCFSFHVKIRWGVFFSETPNYNKSQLPPKRSDHLFRTAQKKTSISILLLMAKKSGEHQLRLVVYSIIYEVLCIQVVQVFSHQQ